MQGGAILLKADGKSVVLFLYAFASTELNSFTDITSGVTLQHNHPKGDDYALKGYSLDKVTTPEGHASIISSSCTVCDLQTAVLH